MAKASGDKFVQYASITTVESAANTLTFQQLQTGGMLFERRAFLIHRVEYDVPTSQLLAIADTIKVGLSLSNTMSDVQVSDPNVIDLMVIRRHDFGTAASGQMYTTPLIRDYSTLPGGGLIVPSHPLFGFVRGGSVAAAVTVIAKIYFTLRTLTAEEFIELVEALRVIT